MGQESKYFKVSGLRLLQALTPRELDYSPDFARPSGPLSRHRERGWGESWGPQRVARPDEERRVHRSGEGCP